MKWLVPLPLFALLSCTGTDVGNSPRLDFTLHDLSSTATLAALSNGLTISQGYVAVERIRLGESVACDSGSEHEINDPFALDLLMENNISSLKNLGLGSKPLCRIEFGWHAYSVDDLPAGTPAELAGASIFIAGSRNDGTPVVLRSERNDQFQMDARGGSFTVNPTLGGLLIGLDATILFTGLDLSSAVINNGVIRIEPGSNQDLLDAFDAHVVAATKLFGDQNGDGELSGDETRDTDTLADSH